LHESRIYVGVDVIFGPLNTVCVELLGIVRSTDWPTSRGSPEGIGCGGRTCQSVRIGSNTTAAQDVRTPVERGSEDISSASRIFRTVSSGLHNVDFARLWPFPIHGCLWHHPNSGPKPVSTRYLRHDFHASISNRLLPYGAEPRRPHRRNHSTKRRIRRNRTRLHTS
jgi:hypothetical protein